MDFNKNELINETVEEFKGTWNTLVDTPDYIQKKSLKKIDNYIDKALDKKFKHIDVYDLLHLQEKGYKLSIFQKMKIYFSGLKPLYLAEKKEKECAEKKAAQLKKKKAKERADKKAAQEKQIKSEDKESGM